MAVDLVVKNGRIVTPGGVLLAGIAVDKGKIVSIAAESILPQAERTIDATGKHVLPGLIDPHCHFGYTGPIAEQITGDTAAAAAGGVTTFGHYLGRSVTEDIFKAADDAKKALQERSLIDGFFHVIIFGGERQEQLPRLVREGINSFKFLMGYKGRVATVSEGKVIEQVRPATDDGVLFDGLEKISRLGHPARAMVHAENIDIISVIRPRLRKAGRQDAGAWEETRPYWVEAEAMRRAIYLAQITQCPLYIVHMSIGSGVDIIARAKVNGTDVVAETCPQYLTHDNAALPPIFAKYPTLAVVNPPLRYKEDIEKLWQGIKDGWIECIGSDYAPVPLTQKGDDLWAITQPGVGNITEMILPVMLSEGVNKGRISLETVVKVCCYNPARIFGLLPEKGQISVGSDADLVIVDMDKKVNVTLDLLHCPFADWTIYDGWEFNGWPIMTILRGKVIVENGQVIGKPGNGKWYSGKIH